MSIRIFENSNTICYNFGKTEQEDPMAKDVRKKIINTSYELFQKNGYNQVTVNDICDACGITKTTFYRYLSSKEDTLAYFFDSINDELGELMLDLAAADNHWEQICSAFSLILNRIQNLGRDLYARLWITNLKSYQGSFDEIEILRGIVIILIQKAQEKGQIENMMPADKLYNMCSDICFGCAGKWAMGLSEHVEVEFEKSLRVALMVKNEI